ncbi:MAG TPA: AAC(3) family N-acetyltransferase [Candidatus Polarisedimenticolaceae bacterium]
MAIRDVVRALALHYLPSTWARRLKAMQMRRRRAAVEAHPPLSEEEFRRFARERLGFEPGAAVFVHSSEDLLHLAFSPLRLLEILLELVGDEGTLLFPTFPSEGTYEVLRSGRVFDVRRTPGGTGLLGELARRLPGARRSVHPTRSVVALGRHAEALVARHHEDPYPFSASSPFALHAALGGRVVGLGVSTKNLTLVHVLDDLRPERLPCSPYVAERFDARCRRADGVEVVVAAYAHDQRRMTFDVPRFVRDHVVGEVARDFRWRGMDFFRVEAGPFLARLDGLSATGITIYGDGPGRES